MLRGVLMATVIALLSGCVRYDADPPPAAAAMPMAPVPAADLFAVLNGGFLDDGAFGNDMVAADRAARDYCASLGKVPELLGRPAVSGTQFRAATYVCRTPVGVAAQPPAFEPVPLGGHPTDRRTLLK